MYRPIPPSPAQQVLPSLNHTTQQSCTTALCCSGGGKVGRVAGVMGIACISTAPVTTSRTGHLSLCPSSPPSLWLIPHLTILPYSRSLPLRLHRPFVTCQRYGFHKPENPGQWRGAMVPLMCGSHSNNFQKSARWAISNTTSNHFQPNQNFEPPSSRTDNYNWKLFRQQNEYESAAEIYPPSSPLAVRPEKSWLKERDKILQLTVAHNICGNFATMKTSTGPSFLSETKVDDSQGLDFQNQAQLRASTLTQEDYVSSPLKSPSYSPLLLEDDYVGYKLENQNAVVDEALPGEIPQVDTEKTNLNEPHTIARNEQTRNLLRIYDHVLVVDTISKARHVVHLLTTRYKYLIHACDTEVSNIDVKQETPVGHGELICFSIYSGSTADFGNGKSCIWVDVLDGESNILMEFVPFFEDASIKKVWHNYSFDCHIIQNYNIKLSGFHADTIHLARLWDSSRRMDGGYSLEALTSDPRVVTSNKGDLTVGKISMKDIFGKKKVKKDGTEGKIVTIAPVDILQREERIPWICYSALDSISTLKLFECLKLKLLNLHWEIDGQTKGSMYDFYEEYWRPFGNLLIEMEAAGMLVDRNHLSEIEKVAVAEQRVAADKFRKWASKYCADAKDMNVGSDTQIRQLFFGGATNNKNPNECLPTSKTFKVLNVDNVIGEGKKAPSKYRNISLHKIGDVMQTEIFTASGWPSVGGDALKTFAGSVSTDDSYLPFDDCETEDGTGDVDIEILSENNPNKQSGLYGAAYAAFGKGRKGREACQSIAALCEICSIDSLISNFILPLQGDRISGKDGRIHCSLNINTETGRLSARRPNLQNPPALEKDRYKIRQAFIASPGNSLIVADYGQLELRILAHLAGCTSMLDAFKAGGDFHSRTAMNMYSFIREAVEKKEVLLEWYPQSGEDKPPAPLLKDKFASERRRAKMLNFSIAYGKTPVGLSRDWKVSLKEAKETVKLWYKERQEVLKWQEARKREALKHGMVKTLLGRSRKFPSVKNLSNAQKGHIERAAINTPVQGSAADVAMCAMIQIARNERLKELGWKLLLQVHDEVILEGPSNSAEEAKSIVVECMSKPFYGRNILSVDLSVDAKCAQSWYAAK